MKFSFYLCLLASRRVSRLPGGSGRGRVRHPTLRPSILLREATALACQEALEGLLDRFIREVPGLVRHERAASIAVQDMTVDMILTRNYRNRGTWFCSVKVHDTACCEHWLGLSSPLSRPVLAATYATGTASMLYGAMPARPCRMNSIASAGSMVS